MLRIQPGIEFPIIPEDFVVAEGKSQPGASHLSGEKEFPKHYSHTGSKRLSHKGKYRRLLRLSTEHDE